MDTYMSRVPRHPGHTRQQSEKMMSQPLVDVGTACSKCPTMQAAVIIGGNNLTPEEKGILRVSCSYCKSTGSGIYKADAILTAETQRTVGVQPSAFKGKGRQPVAFKRYGQTVKNLYEQGQSLRQIAKTIGISINTVRKIIAQHQSNDSRKK